MVGLIKKWASQRLSFEINGLRKKFSLLSVPVVHRGLKNSGGGVGGTRVQSWGRPLPFQGRAVLLQFAFALN